MKSSKNIITILLILIVSACIHLHAEDSIMNRNVNVEREYKPVIQDVGKINSLPNILEPNIEKTTAKYSEFNLPLSVDYNLHTLTSAQPTSNKYKNINAGYARFGFGNPLNTLADFAYPILSQSDSKLDFSVNHLATFENKTHSNTKAALLFNKNFNDFDVYAGMGGGHEYFKYYGNNFNDSAQYSDIKALAGNPAVNFKEKTREGLNKNRGTLDLHSFIKDSTNTFWRMYAYAGFKSNSSAKILSYKAELNYKLFNTLSGTTEHIIHTLGRFSIPNKNNRLGLDLDLYNLAYQSSTPTPLNYESGYSIFSLNPYYGIERETWKVRLGIKSSFPIANGKTASPSADIKGEWKALPKYLSLYGGISGGYTINSMNEILAENPYLLSELRVEDTYTPVNIYAGIKVKPLYNLMLDTYFDYRQIKSQYFFVNKAYSTTNSSLNSDSVLYTNRFNVLYSDAKLLKLGLRANYNLQGWLNIQAKTTYNSWSVATEQYAWNKPMWESDLSTSIQVTKEIQLSASAYYEAGRYAKLGNLSKEMKNKMDINLGGSYSFNNWISSFAKINNLLNTKNQYYYGYEVQGINALIGAAFSF